MIKHIKKSKGIINNGTIKVVSTSFGVNIFWNEVEITKNVGLNIGLNTLGLWTDSSKADWSVLEQGIDYIVLKNRWKELPISQFWRLELKENNQVSWQVEMETEEELWIDEKRVVILVSEKYNNWINSSEEGCFPQITNFQEIPLSNLESRNVGVMFYEDKEEFPCFVLEYVHKMPIRVVSPCIQNIADNTNARLIGFTMSDGEHPGHYPVGQYNLFSGNIKVFKYNKSISPKEDIFPYKDTNVKGELSDYGKFKRRSMRVLLVNLPWQVNGVWGVRAGSRWPHIKDKSEGYYLPFPFFLAYANALLQNNDIDARIIDAIAEQIPEDIFIEKVLNMDFDYLVVETSIPSLYDDIRMLKRIHKPGMRIILCGPNSEIYNPQFLKDHTFIDFILYGEYEFTLLELINTLQHENCLSKVNGLLYQDNNEVIKNAKRPPSDINLLPWPTRGELPMEKYWDLPGNIPSPSVQMLASRGCPFGCNFCLWPQVMYQGTHYRARDVKDVIDEMEYLVKDRGFKSVYFDDDTFNIGKERMLQFSGEIKKRGLQSIPWAIMARPDLMDREILSEMKSAGLWAVKYGVESVCDELLKNYQKKMDFSKTNQVVRMTKDLGIKVHLTFAFGIDGETKDTIDRTINYALKVNPNSVQFTILTPFPGTKLFDALDRDGRILTRDWSKYDGHYHCIFKHDNLSIQELEEAKRRAYMLWGEHCRRERGFLGDLKRFIDYVRKEGIKKALIKAMDYFSFILIKRKTYLDGKN